jgi:hypothetical protein
MVLFKGAEGEYKSRWPVNTFEPGLFPIVYTSRHSFSFPVTNTIITAQRFDYRLSSTGNQHLYQVRLI